MTKFSIAMISEHNYGPHLGWLHLFCPLVFVSILFARPKSVISICASFNSLFNVSHLLNHKYITHIRKYLTENYDRYKVNPKV